MKDHSGADEERHSSDMHRLLSELETEMARLRQRVRMATLILGPSSPLDDIEHSMAACRQIASRAKAVLGDDTAVPGGDGGSQASPPAHDLATMRSVVSTEEFSRRLAAALDSSLGQLLANAVVELNYAESLIPSDPDALRTGMSALKSELQTGLTQLRWIVGDLRPPPLLNDLGLGPSLLRYAERFGEHYAVPVDAAALKEFSIRLPATVELAVFRVVQEAMRNCQQHAGATRIELGVDTSAGEITFFVRDDGRGFQDEATSEGLGLIAMKERARAIGGTLRVMSRVGEGTTVTISVPYEKLQ